MIPSTLSYVLNHLWQSTLFAAVAALLTLTLRKNRAQTRYWLWFAASVKFLVPFSLLIDAGSRFAWNTSAPAQPSLPYVIEEASRPFVAPAPIATSHLASGSLPGSWLSAVLFMVWAIGAVVVAFFWWRRWHTLRLALREATPMDSDAGITTLESPAFVEPGVFGIWRPAIVLPAGLSDHLTPAQLKAILAHEMCHVRRRDNTAAAVHMCVEALFWFHPLVWWLGRRLMEERENACDEEVLLMGNSPQAYAAGILEICELYLKSPLPCIAGVTGANLKKRIEIIMANRTPVRLSIAKQTGLAAAGIVTVVLPVAIGMMSPTNIRAQSVAAPVPTFEAVSIKPCKQDAHARSDESSPGRLSTRCAVLADTDNTGLIQVAYNRYAKGYMSSFRIIPIEGGPNWIHTEAFEIDARADSHPSVQMMEGPMMQTVLQDRFKLKIHRETRQAPVYELVLSKGSSKSQNLPEGHCAPITDRPLPPLAAGSTHCRNVVSPRGAVDMEGGTLSDFAGLLGIALDRPVIDKTGLTNQFEIHLRFSTDDATGAANPTDAPGVFEAIQEQLGLKLVPARGPVDVLVIDHVERSSEN